MTEHPPSNLPTQPTTFRIDGRASLLFSARLARQLKAAGLFVKMELVRGSDPPVCFLASARTVAAAAEGCAAVLRHGWPTLALQTTSPTTAVITEPARQVGQVVNLMTPAQQPAQQSVTVAEAAHAPGKPVGSFIGLPPAWRDGGTSR